MSDFAETSAGGFFVGCLGIAVVFFAIFGGIALTMYNGAAQTCATHGGHWTATDKPGTGAGDTGSVYRLRECAR
jgi:hypothetical protein